jgi:peptidoglycan/LPS O-acetylase OafA/YrhL
VQCVFPSLDLCCLFVALGVLVADMVTKVFDKIFVRACATTLGFSCIILCFRFD